MPCAYGECLFCLNDITSRIYHAGEKRKAPPVVEYKCGTRVKTAKFSTENVDLGKSGSDCCRVCYRHQDKSLTAKHKKKNFNTSRLGCVICKKEICKGCWDSVYDRHIT